MSEINKLSINMPAALKADLDLMSEELNMSRNQLSILALYSLVGNYKQKGTFIFVDLLNPENKK